MDSDPFARVPGPLREAIVDRGFSELTPVQLAALDAVDTGRDLRITSQTGSGKTVALGLAISAELLDETAPRERTPKALVVVPTRELAAQVHQELKWLYGKVPGVRVDSVTGGTAVGPERGRLAKGPAVLVGTPGRLCDHIRSGALVTSSVRQFVLDEADQMLDLGFKDELDAIAEALPKEGVHTHLMSATFSRPVRELADRIQKDPQHIEGTQLGIANADITHVGHRVHADDRYGALVNLLLMEGSGRRSLVFVATRQQTVQIAEQLERDGFRAMPLSGELPQLQRTRTLDAFKSGTVQVLIATDVAARGIDVPELNMVVHFDLPMDAEGYTHRAGRSGRAGNKGKSVLFVTPRIVRRAYQLLNQAKVEAEWPNLPTAEEVKGAVDGRLHAWIRNKVWEGAGEPDAGATRLAEELIHGGEPSAMMASLIQLLMREVRPREPFDIQTPEFSPERGMSRNPKHHRFDPRSFGDRSFGGGGGDAGFTRFRINWGGRRGATHARLLAAICRRGNITRHQVGKIAIGPHDTTFDVADEAAKQFESATRKPDNRDPDQYIVPHEGPHNAGQPPVGGRPFGKKPFRKGGFKGRGR